MNHLPRGWWAGLFLAAAVIFSGCSTPSKLDPLNPLGEKLTPGVVTAATATNLSNYALRVGDQLTITFIDVAPPLNAPIPVELREDGTIVLIYNKTFHAEGKTISQLEKDIQAAYVPSIFTLPITVTITPANRYYSVDGEVRQPNRYPYPGHMTVLNAIAAAGGFTEFASPKKVQVTRAIGGKPITVNAKKALDDPKLDLDIYPGDKIHVPKSWF